MCQLVFMYGVCLNEVVVVGGECCRRWSVVGMSSKAGFQGNEVIKVAGNKGTRLASVGAEACCSLPLCSAIRGLSDLIFAI
jgi:hypothetical protein